MGQIIKTKGKKEVSIQDKVFNPVMNTYVDKFRYERALIPDTRDPNVNDNHKFSQ